MRRFVLSMLVAVVAFSFSGCRVRTPQARLTSGAVWEWPFSGGSTTPRGYFQQPMHGLVTQDGALQRGYSAGPNPTVAPMMEGQVPGSYMQNGGVPQTGPYEVQQGVATQSQVAVPQNAGQTYSTPQYSTPQQTVQQYGVPQSAGQTYSTPQYSTPQYSTTPQYSVPQSSAGQYTSPQYTPQNPTQYNVPTTQQYMPPAQQYQTAPVTTHQFPPQR